LLELIFSIIVLSIVGIYSVIFLKEMYDKNSKNYQTNIIQLELESTRVFIENLLQNCVNITTTPNSISFYKIDTKAYNSNLWSGFTDLDSNQTNKAQLKTPNSKINELTSNYIWFLNNKLYQIKNSNDTDIIKFTKTSLAKRIYEHYKIIKSISSIILNDNKLLYDGNILLQNITKFEISNSAKLININICIKQDSEACQTWNFII